MLQRARLRIEAAGLEGRIDVAQVDAKRLPYESARFEAVMSNSIVHHLAEPRHVLTESVRVVRPGGFVFFRDLLRPATEAELQGLVVAYANEETAHARQLFEQSLRAALSLDEMQQLVQEMGCAPGNVTRTSDRHWTWFTRMPSA
jgi:ubiquinone/menaquinone biosynthesis C-methylase UbiE